jgi:hypothetical protein
MSEAEILRMALVGVLRWTAASLGLVALGLALDRTRRS